MNFPFKLGIIGFGNMATAISSGVVKSKALKQSEILIYDHTPTKRDNAKAYGYCVTEDILDLAENCEYVLFAVKPQSFTDVAEKIGGKIKGGKIISILAGTTIAKYHEYFANAQILRVMPNTPALIGLGMSAIAIDDADETLVNFGKALFESVGKVIMIKEREINAVIAVSGSGPAYVYEFMSAMYNKAISLNFDPETAKTLVAATTEGAAEMFLTSTDDIKTLCDKVCSKGGTTIEAVKHFRENGLNELVDGAMTACFNRAEELSK